MRIKKKKKNEQNGSIHTKKVEYSNFQSILIYSNPYERLNPSCNYGLSIYCHNPSLLIGQTTVPGARRWHGNLQPPHATGRCQPARDYASNQCPAMLMDLGRVKCSNQSNGSGGRGRVLGVEQTNQEAKDIVMMSGEKKRAKTIYFNIEMKACSNQMEINGTFIEVNAMEHRKSGERSE